MRDFKSLGTAQTVKTYKRHGSGDNVFGVSFADIRRLQKKIKVNHRLARELWQSGNTDARALALLIADPSELSEEEASAWLKDSNYFLLDLLADPFSRAAFSQSLAERWMSSEDEFEKSCGYSIISCMLKNNISVSEESLSNYLDEIKHTIHASPNRARHSMNSTIMAIGIYTENLREKALACADAIGKVEVDHGDTSCTTKDARQYILNAAKRPQKKSRV